MRPKLPVIRTLVGFDETRTAEAVLAAINSLKTQAVGSIPAWWVRYARNCNVST